MSSPKKPSIRPCPGLTTSPESGVCFTDSLHRVYDLEREPLLSPGEASADRRLCGMPTRSVLQAVRTGEIYPVLVRNRRRIFIFDCALTDWRARQLGTRRAPTTRLMQLRAAS